MPLPPALLKRLASRGLVQKESSSTEELAKHTSGREEVIAEDYGEMDDPYAYEMQKRPEENYWIETMKRRMAEVGHSGYKGCPNKYNIFHKCSLYCVNKWGDGVLEPNREYLKRRNRLLKRYPLPKNWLEVYDYGCGVHYYWNTSDDTVSWLPPGHSDAQVSKCAALLRRELEEISTGPTEEDMDDDLTEQDIEKILEAPLPTSPKPADSPPPPPQPPAPVLKKPKARDLDKALRHRASRKHKARAEAEPLDPMDPAAYSDIPRGKWSDGLSIESTKSGADPTASGALFQMRPYPSPGAVLQANAASKPRSESKEE